MRGRVPVRVRRIAAVVVVLLYVGVSALFGVRHLLGDSLSHPTAYFFTWDMFPGYATDSSRRYFVGMTRSSRYVQLLPSSNEQFHWGINNDVRRIDIDRRAENFLPALRRSVQRYNREHPDDPISLVVLVERYWPFKFNLPDDLYESAYGEPNPHRKYWRMMPINLRPQGSSAERDEP
ncbi:MAG: hypothetical protein IID45_10780 [Planctomycetes bacterium]|nr:hypothetical protein [Planctomycetota bacterium]